MITMPLEAETELHKFLNSRKGAAISGKRCIRPACNCIEEEEDLRVVWRPPLLDPEGVLHRTCPAPNKSLLLRLFQDTWEF